MRLNSQFVEALGIEPRVCAQAALRGDIGLLHHPP
jgi:hypothetical protein